MMGVMESAGVLPLSNETSLRTLLHLGQAPPDALNPVSRPLDMSTSPPSTLSLARATHPGNAWEVPGYPVIRFERLRRQLLAMVK